MTMAFVDGESLAERLARDGQLPPDQAVRLVRTVALAMQEAHDRDILHRDLKPGNILLNRRGEPVIVDFGLAGSSHTADGRLTVAGTLLGTPAYMSPEQARGEVDAIGPATDVYGLGVILYEMLAGRPPFRDDNVLTLLDQVRSQTPPAPSQFRPDLDPALEAICLKALAKQPEARYASMAELAAALDRWLQARATRTNGHPPRFPMAWVLVALAFAALFLGGIVLIIRNKYGRETGRHRLPPGGTMEVVVEPPSSDDRAGTPPVSSKEREIALWVLEGGGQIKVHGPDKTITRPSELPADTFQVQLVDLLAVNDIHDADLARLLELSQLQVLLVSGPELTDEALPIIGRITTLKQLTVGAPRVTDAGLRHLSALRDLEVLQLNGAACTGDGLPHLLGLRLLCWLDLSKTKVTDAALAELARFGSLHSLVLHQTGITDNGLVHLRQVAKLKHLDLKGTDVSDEGINHLRAIPGLRELVVTGTKLSPRGVESLQAALPNCKVEY